MGQPPRVTRIGEGVYRVEHDGGHAIVYVAGSARERWAFWNGRVFRDHGERDEADARESAVTRGGARARADGMPSTAAQVLAAPMPATVIRIAVTPGSAVKKGDTIIVLEAMKMELPLRAPSDGTVTAVHCREGDLVLPDVTLAVLE